MPDTGTKYPARKGYPVKEFDHARCVSSWGSRFQQVEQLVVNRNTPDIRPDNQAFLYPAR
jgi:hypothetical protein